MTISQFSRGMIGGLMISFLLFYLFSFFVSPSCPYREFHGGSPDNSLTSVSHPIARTGSCWCGSDDYCLCTPSLAIDAIIEVTSIAREKREREKERGNIGREKGREKENEISPQNDVYVVLVQRRDQTETTHAIPGGFVSIGETVEEATLREVKEETNLDLEAEQISQWKVYSDPARDTRRHTVSAVFRCPVQDISQIKHGDDAKAVVIVSLKKSLYTLKFAFDHRLILEDYVRTYHPSLVSTILQ
jgi:8-oxo-dGTP diphosphatase